MTATLHVAALQLAQRGLHVFPCQPRGKTPACDTGFHAATTDIERINRWWHAFPDLNIGIATGTISNIFVLDVDGTDGETSLRKLEQTHGALPPTVEAITGKGRHCYYKLGQHKISNSAGVIGAGLDIRGTGKAGKPLEHWHKVLTEPIRDGQRNVTLASLTGKYLHMGVNDAFLLFDTIMCINLARCEPPLSADEIEVIVSSVIRRHLRGLRT